MDRSSYQRAVTPTMDSVTPNSSANRSKFLSYQQSQLRKGAAANKQLGGNTNTLSGAIGIGGASATTQQKLLYQHQQQLLHQQQQQALQQQQVGLQQGGGDGKGTVLWGYDEHPRAIYDGFTRSGRWRLDRCWGSDRQWYYGTGSKVWC